MRTCVIQEHFRLKAVKREDKKLTITFAFVYSLFVPLPLSLFGVYTVNIRTNVPPHKFSQ